MTLDTIVPLGVAAAMTLFLVVMVGCMIFTQGR
jgi:hypothetical protein